MHVMSVPAQRLLHHFIQESKNLVVRTQLLVTIMLIKNVVS